MLRHLLHSLLALAVLGCTSPSPPSRDLPPNAGVSTTAAIGELAVDPDPAVAFPQLRAPSSSMMEALLQGTLTLKDGCLRVVAPDDPTGHLVLWQPGYDHHRRGDTLEISGPTGKPVARVGEPIALGGGEIPLSPELTAQLEQPVPNHCGGPYWLMGALVARE